MRYLPKLLDAKNLNLPEFDFSEPDIPGCMTGFIELLQALKLGSVPEGINALKKAAATETEPQQRALLALALYRQFYASGKHIHAAKCLGIAWSLIKDTNNLNLVGLTQVLMSQFLITIGMDNAAAAIYNDLPETHDSEVLDRLSQWERINHRIFLNNLPEIDEINRLQDWFQQSNMPFNAVSMYLTTGRCLLKSNKVDQAQKILELGIEQTSSIGDPITKFRLLVSLGVLEFYNRDNFQASRRHLTRAATEAPSLSVRCFALLHLSAIHSSRENLDMAIARAQEAFNLTMDQGAFYMIPGICGFLGSLYEGQGQSGLAGMFLKRGYQTAHEFLKNHFPYSVHQIGNAIERYISYLESRPTHEPNDNADFSFALNRTLDEIRDLFSSAFMKAALRRDRTASNAAQKAGLSRQTWAKIRSRIDPEIWKDQPETVKQIVQQTNDTDWRTFQNNYENQIILYLHEQYDFDKRKLAEDLGISYSRLTQLINRARQAETVPTKTK